MGNDVRKEGRTRSKKRKPQPLIRRTDWTGDSLPSQALALHARHAFSRAGTDPEDSPQAKVRKRKLREIERLHGHRDKKRTEHSNSSLVGNDIYQFACKVLTRRSEIPIWVLHHLVERGHKRIGRSETPVGSPEYPKLDPTPTCASDTRAKSPTFLQSSDVFGA